MTGTGPITITKLEAAEWQFRQAVRLHFGGTDPVSAHTLAAAACEVLRDLAKHRGVPHPFLDGILPLIPPEKRKEIRRLFKKGQNFLKHATTDPDESITMNPEFTELLLFEAARAHGALTGYETPENVRRHHVGLPQEPGHPPGWRIQGVRDQPPRPIDQSQVPRCAVDRDRPVPR